LLVKKGDDGSGFLGYPVEPSFHSRPLIYTANLCLF
jgi:hypothetical protein